MSLRVVSQITAAGTALSNSTTETSLARYTFAADELKPGQVWLIQSSIRATATNSTDTLLQTLRFGSSSTASSNTSCGAGTAVDAANGDVGVIRAVLEVHSATRAVIYGTITDCDAVNSAALHRQFSAILTIAAGTAYYLDVTGTWSAASASDSCQAEAFSVLCAV